MIPQYLAAHPQFVSAIAGDLAQAVASVQGPDVPGVLLARMAAVATMVSLDTGYVGSALCWDAGAAVQAQQQLPGELLSQLSHSDTNLQRVLDAGCGAGFDLRRVEDLRQVGNKHFSQGSVYQVHLGALPWVPPVKQALPSDDAPSSRLLLVIPELPASPPVPAAAEGAPRPPHQPPPPPVQLSGDEWVVLVTAAITWLLTAVTPRFGRPLPPAAAFGDQVAWACAVQAAWVKHLPLISPNGWQPVLGQRAGNVQQQQQHGGKRGKKNAGGPQCAEIR